MNSRGGHQTVSGKNNSVKTVVLRTAAIHVEAKAINQSKKESSAWPITTSSAPRRRIKKLSRNGHQFMRHNPMQ
jgi:hypothetical protein